MKPRFQALAYFARVIELMAVLAQLGTVLLYRRLCKRPTEGPLLVREAFEKLSGSFIKFGQILSLQIDSLPREYCDSLLALLDRVPQFPPEQVRQVFLDEFRAAPEDLYQEFEYKAIASASIGQVHRARLKDGTPVAVKVQRPGIRMVFERDNFLLRGSIRVIFMLRIRSMYFMRDPVRELSTWTNDELDYRREAAYAKLLGDNAVQTPTERVPRVFWELTARRVLTMDFLDGPSVASYLRMVERNDEAGLQVLRDRGFIPERFSSNVISNFLSDAFRFGVFHADLHPANLLILPNNVVGYVDFGIVATLTPEARRKQIELTLAYASGNADAIYESFISICMLSPDADLEGMRTRIQELASEWYDEPAIAGRVRFRVSVTKTMMDLLSICQNYGVLVDREMIKYIRSTILADGLVSRLAPGFDLAHALREVVEGYLEEEARQKIFSRGGALAMLADLTVWMQSGPASLLHAMNLLERRQLRVRAGVNSRPDRDARLRVRAIFAGAVWCAGVLGLTLGEGFPGADLRQIPTIIAGLFLALWTLWLLRLLQRLAAR